MRKQSVRILCAMLLLMMLPGGPHPAAASDTPLVAGWGSNSLGDIGVGRPDEIIPTPALIGLPGHIVAISGGVQHTLALLDDGIVRSWGSNGRGQLGVPTGECVPHNQCSSIPVVIAGLSNVTAIAAGYEHSLALLSDGTVRGWGSNVAGEAGNGKTSLSVPTPTPVVGLAGVVAIAAGVHFSLALRGDGTVWGWGTNASGETGRGSTQLFEQPTPVPVPGLTGVAAIAAGANFALALLQDGTVRGWGNNQLGYLGDGTFDNVRWAPVPVANLTHVVAITAGNGFSFARTADGAVYSWGTNTNGELATLTTGKCGQENGDSPNRSCSATPTLVTGLQGVTAIALGEGFGIAMLADSTVRVWGRNDNRQLGQLADESCSCSLAPLPLSGIRGAQLVGAGRSFGFVVATQIDIVPPPQPPNPIPSLTTLSPTHVQAGGAGLTLTVRGTGFVAGVSTVQWDGSARPTTFVSNTELQATLSAADVATSAVVDVTVANPAPGGGSSFAIAFIITQGAAPVTASASGASVSQSGTATASVGGTGPSTTGSLSAAATGVGTVTVAQYGGNPGGVPNFGVGNNSATTAFMDLHVSLGNSFTTLTIVNCNLNGATAMYWWTGTAWIVASNQSATPTGCITVTVTDATSPNIGNLTGTYVAAGQPTGLPLIFADVPTTSPAYEAIRQLNQRGVIRGYGDGNFGPGDSTLRAQMAALIARAMGWDGESHGNTFPDKGMVDDNLWRNVGTLNFYGVAKGYGDGTYNPTGDVVYVQTVLFISRAMVAKHFWVQQPDDPNLYPNLPSGTEKERNDRRDISTYVHYAGALPDILAGAGQPFANWDQPSNRAWFARALWQALVSYYGSPAQVP